MVRRGIIPSVNPAQAIAALFIAALTLAVPESPGLLLTAFTVGQFAIMLAFVWLFTHRFGPGQCLRHLFIGVSLLAVVTVALLYLSPELVLSEGTFSFGETRLQGDYIADTASVAAIGFVLILSSVPPLRGAMFLGATCLFGGLLVASRTRNAYVALLVFLVIGFAYGKKLRVRQLALPLAALALTLSLLDSLSSTTDFLVRERESVQTMSDRIPLWQHLTSVVMDKAPITGLGYYAASRVVATEYNSRLGNAHSVFFEVLVGGGILGAALYVVLCATLILFAVRLLWVAGGEPAAVAAVGLFAVALLMGVTTSSGLQPEPLGFAFWLSTALLPELLRESARARAAANGRIDTRSSRVRPGYDRFVAVTDRQGE
jgi:O-antigen ligase